MWDKAYDEESIFNSVQQVGDGGYIAVGTKDNKDILLVRTDANGNVQWEKTLGRSDNEWGYGVWPTSDGGYAVIGEEWSTDPGTGHMWLVKTDASGNQQWDKVIDPDAPNTHGYAVQQTRDGGYILAGQYEGHTQMWLVKTDASGNKIWENTFDDIGDGNALAVQQTWDDGYIVAGYKINSNVLNVTAVRLNSAGSVQWTKELASSVTDDNTEMASVQQIGDGSYVIGAFSGEDVSSSNFGNGYFVKLASDMTCVPNAQFVSDTIPSQMEADQSYTVSMTFTNNGTKPWTFQDNTTMGNTGYSTGDAAKFGAAKNQTI